MSDPLTYDPGYGPLVTSTVTIATWNLWARYGPWEARQPVIGRTLQAVNADIIALQEVWDDGTTNQARAYADALGYLDVAFAPNLERDGVHAGNAIVSRWPIARHESRLLPRDAGDVRDDENEERVVLFAEIEGPRGPIQVFCAHLSWRDDHSAVRQLQVAAICQFVREMRPRPFPAVLCGDLNADPASDEIRMLTGRAAVAVPGVVFRDAWELGGRRDRDPGLTTANANPFMAANLDVEKRIDYIMVGQPKLGGVGHVTAIELIGNAPIEGIWPSDHSGVVAQLRY
jgi:endonuclease/exonuclease/phosphatase family metal-dependent hydrolase